MDDAGEEYGVYSPPVAASSRSRSVLKINVLRKFMTWTACIRAVNGSDI
jgi:hypothetical protein